MRVSKEKAAANRARILTEAARLFRAFGISGVGVDAVTDAAGLTHGSLYSQFGSKELLAAAALRHAGSDSAERLGDAESLEALVARYLTPEHRERRGEGCVIAAMAGEMPRQTDPIRRGFTELVEAMTARTAHLLPEGDAARDEALAIVAGMVGALILARGVDDRDLSDRILAANRARLSRS